MKRLPALVAPLLVLALAGPAAADSIKLPDPAGDASSFHYDPDPPPCGTSTVESTPRNDIRRLVVRHTARQVVIGLGVKHMTSPRNMSIDFRVAGPRRSYDISLVRAGRRHVVLYSRPLRPPKPSDGNECGLATIGGEAWTCSDSGSRSTGSVGRATGRIQVSLPRECLSNPRWVRVGASLTGFVDETTYSDSWAPSGHAEGDHFEPVLSPRVRAAAPVR